MVEVRRETLPDGRLKVWYWTPRGEQRRIYSHLWGHNAMSRTTRLGTRLPRVPLPRQTGGAHTPKPKRKVKHPKKTRAEVIREYEDYLDE